MEFFLIFSLIRIFAALLILKWPLFGILLSVLMDGLDWDFLHTTKNFNYDLYNVWDKAMDITYLTVAATTIRNWKDIIAQRIAMFLYIFRLTGVFIFFLSNIKPLLFFFPNIFEHFFIWFLIFAHFNKKIVPRSRLVWGFILVSIAAPKIIHEYVMHIKNQQLWYIWDFNFIDKTNETLKQYMNWVGWGSIFYLIPFSMALWVALKYRR